MKLSVAVDFIWAAKLSITTHEWRALYLLGRKGRQLRFGVPYSTRCAEQFHGVKKRMLALNLTIEKEEAQLLNCKHDELVDGLLDLGEVTPQPGCEFQDGLTVTLQCVVRYCRCLFRVKSPESPRATTPALALPAALKAHRQVALKSRPMARATGSGRTRYSLPFGGTSSSTREKASDLWRSPRTRLSVAPRHRLPRALAQTRTKVLARARDHARGTPTIRPAR